MTEQEKIIELAKSQLSVKAEKNKVVKYSTEYYGQPKGVDWCVIFVWWLFNHSGLASLFYDGGKTASCGALWTWAKNKKQVVYNTDDIRPGDIVIFSFYEAHDHMGICETSDRNTVTTIDGNTSILGSQSQGGQVLRRKRNKKYIFAIVRPAYTEDPTEVIKYVVVKGDNLTKIAKAHNTTVSELLKLNPEIKNPSLIRIGQVIRIK